MKKSIFLLAVFFFIGLATAAHATPVFFDSVPESASMMLMGTGLLGLGIISRRKIKK